MEINIDTLTVVTSINVVIKYPESLLEKEVNILNAGITALCAYAYDGDLMLNPPEEPNKEPNIIFELDFVFTKAVAENIAENLIKTIKPRIKSFFVLSKLKEPIMEFKNKAITKTT